ncbi:MAG: GntR family transcriptional regulator [Candidatus Acidiferrales bacterium]
MKIPPLLRIDAASPIPLYRQIVSELRALLVSGELAPGDSLPPVRQLAMDLNVHHNTVALAYRHLAEEGWLDLRRGRGANVLPRSGPRSNPAAKQTFFRNLRRLVAEAASQGVPAYAIAEVLGSQARRMPPQIAKKGSRR